MRTLAMTLFIPLAAAVPASRTECLKPTCRPFTMPWICWLLMKWLKSSPKLVSSMTTCDGAEMNLSLMPSEADVGELVVLATVQREDAVVDKSFMPSGINDGDLILDVAVERDEAAMVVSVEVAVAEKTSLQLVDDITGDD